MSRLFCIPSIFFLLVALVVSFLASISLPYLPVFSVVRTDFNPAQVQNEMTNMRYGIWTSCYYNEAEDKTCQKNSIAYTVTIEAGNESVEIGSSWTRGLVIQPVATAVTLIALCLSLSTNLFVMMLALIVSFAAAAIHLIVFLIQIALFAYVKKKMNDLDIDANTKPAPGFWLTFASMILCLLGACTVCFGRRRDKSKRDLAKASIPVAATPVDTTPIGTEKSKLNFLSKFRKTEPSASESA